MRKQVTSSERTIDLETIVMNFCHDVDHDIELRFSAWKPDFSYIAVHEVIGGLLARQATLAKEIVSAPSIWNGHAAPIFLRAMADVYINFAWLLLDAAERCLKYISFGLGQAKLELEHFKAEIGDRTPTTEEAEVLEMKKQWIDTQRLCFLQDIDLGKWAGLSVRQMAVEADCLDFYTFVYTPFSACAHSMWHHVAHYNLDVCNNPLHRYHRRPVSSALDPDFYYPLLAAKYWNKTLVAFDLKYLETSATSSAFDNLLAAIKNVESIT